MKITHEGLVAGVRFLQERYDGFDDGTGDHFHTPFIHELLMEVFRASGITLDMPAEQRYELEPNVSPDHQETVRIVAFRAGPDDEHLPRELYFLHP